MHCHNPAPLYRRSGTDSCCDDYIIPELTKCSRTSNTEMIIAVTEFYIIKSFVVTGSNKLQNLFLNGICLIMLFIFFCLIGFFE